jgi:Tfp pilus assembly protein PilE
MQVPQITSQHKHTQGFTFTEVCVAIVIAVLFGAAAFATNNRLLIALKDQKEETAATMMLQERMEKFRSFSYSNVADKNYVLTNILNHSQATTSEAALGNLTEYVTISGYTATSGYTPVPASDYNQWQRNSNHQDGQELNNDTSLATNYDLLKVDIVVTWTGSNGRTHTRELASIFGKGNIGQ